MIAQQSNSSEVRKLYTNKTTDRQTPASVIVEENGMYQVTVFATRGERGIVNSSVEYINMLMDDMSATITAVVTTTVAVTSPGKTS